MGKYLIAGAAGYVGSRLAASLLAQGHTVRGLVRNTDMEVVQRLAAQGMIVWQGDLTQPESLVGVANGVEYVFNLTARSLLENGSVRQLFVEGNRNLIAACSRSRMVRSYVFSGNVAAYGDRGDEWLTEDAPAAPDHPFGQVMFEAEQAIMELVRRHHFPAIVLRIGTIYGPGRDFVDAVESGAVTLIGDGRNFVSHIQIDDLIAVLERVALAGQPGAIYNVADDLPTRALDFYREVSELLGTAPPRPFPKAAALHSGMDPAVVGMAAASTRLSNRRIKEELGLTLRYDCFRAWLTERLGEPLAIEREVALFG